MSSAARRLRRTPPADRAFQAVGYSMPAMVFGNGGVNQTISATPHASTQVGDVLVAAFSFERTSTPGTTGSGWTLLSYLHAGISSYTHATFAKVAVSGDLGTSVGFRNIDNNAIWLKVILATFRRSPAPSTLSYQAGNAEGFTAPSVTMAASGLLVVSCSANTLNNDVRPSFSPPPDMVELADTIDLGAGTGRIGHNLSWMSVPAGATGGKTSSSSQGDATRTASISAGVWS